MNSPLLNAYKQGTKEYKIASDNYEYGYEQGREDFAKELKEIFKEEIIITRTIDRLIKKDNKVNNNLKD